MALLTVNDFNRVFESFTTRNRVTDRINNCVAVVAPTGSGKSTLLPSHFINNKCKIFIVEPTIAGARSLSTFLERSHRGQVGYAAEGEISYLNAMIQSVRPEFRQVKGFDTKAVYCTAGHMKNVLLSFLANGDKTKRLANFCDVLMIDEAHIGSIEYDLVVFLWRYLLEQGWDVPRMMLSSATYSTTASPIEPDEVVTIGARPYNVEEMYHPKTYKEYDHTIYSDLAKLVQVNHNAAPPGRKADTWLLFLPGSGEVEKVVGMIREHIGTRTDVEVVAAYSNVSPDEMARIFQPVQPGIRRIVVATNVAETSLTLDNVSLVIDSMLEKVLLTSDMGGERLEIRYISKDSATQRKGRTGRTTNGRCYRMMKAEDYAKLDQSRVREIERAPIHSVILELLANKIHPAAVFRDKVTPRRLDNSQNVLISLGCLEDSSAMVPNGIPFVTPTGMFVSKMQLSPRMGVFMWKWDQRGLPVSVGAGIAAMIDMFVPSYFYISYPTGTNPETRKDIREAQLRDKFKSFNEGEFMTPLGVMINLWNALIAEFKSYSVPKARLAKFSAQHSLDNRKINEVFRVFKQIMNYYTRQGRAVELGPFRRLTTLPIVTSILREIFPTIRLENGRLPRGYFVSENYQMVIPGSVHESDEMLLLITAQVNNRIQISLGEPLYREDIFPKISQPVSAIASDKPRRPGVSIRFSDDTPLPAAIPSTITMAKEDEPIVLPVSIQPTYVDPSERILIGSQTIAYDEVPQTSQPFKIAVPSDIFTGFTRRQTVVIPEPVQELPRSPREVGPMEMLYADGTPVDTMNPLSTQAIWLPLRQSYGLYDPFGTDTSSTYVEEDGLRFRLP